MNETLLAALLAIFSPGAHASDRAQATPGPAVQQKVAEKTPIYGSQLMTPQERDAYRAKMRSAKTQAERDQIRLQHHDEMQLRAKERGVTLPAEPPPRRGAPRGPGGGPGMGGGPNR